MKRADTEVKRADEAPDAAALMPGPAPRPGSGTCSGAPAGLTTLLSDAETQARDLTEQLQTQVSSAATRTMAIHLERAVRSLRHVPQAELAHACVELRSPAALANYGVLPLHGLLPHVRVPRHAFGEV
ncbi:hypothetical protein GCM10010433_52990 [Streptomyces pulveraceus]